MVVAIEKRPRFEVTLPRNLYHLQLSLSRAWVSSLTNAWVCGWMLRQAVFSMMR
eukprot:COSAG01_NODE_3407_length_6130_cov_3.343890_2_plen_54_part_00